MFRVSINTENAAFGETEADARHTIIHMLLTAVSDGLDSSSNGGPLRDDNGNTCGEWSLVDLDTEGEFVQIIADRTEERCRICLAGSRGTCTRATAYDDAAGKVVHQFDAVTMASGRVRK